MPKTVLAFGEILWDIFPDHTTLGGAPFNFAYRIHSLGNTAFFVSAVGVDDLGDKACRQAMELGIDTSGLQRNDHPTGSVPITFDGNMNPRFEIVPDVAYDHITMSDTLGELSSSSDCIYFGTLAQRHLQSRETLAAILSRSPTALKAYDINLRKDCYGPEMIEESLYRADLLKINDEEVRVLRGLLDMRPSTIRGFCDEALRRWSLRGCIVTLGARGIYGASADGSTVYAPGYKVETADTVGAGDACAAGCVHRLLEGASLAEACEFGNLLGAIVATQKGATRPIAVSDIEEFRSRPFERLLHEEFRAA